MSFDWTDYLTLAQELTSESINSPIEEAHLRAAISRAYYAAFCTARNFLSDNDGYLPPGGTNVHRDIVDKLETSSDLTRRKVGALLRSLRGIRNIVDYQEAFYGNKLGRTQGALATAKQIISLLGTI